jgi:3-oxoacyl-[acyl-carrier-protein] synthase III
MTYASQITGTGSAFPEFRMTNDAIAQKLAAFNVETNDQWIRERTGIQERRISDENNPEEFNSSLGARAAHLALEMAGKTAADIDQIIYATCSPDTQLPSTACWLQHRIGATKAWAMDLNAACSGFIYGLATADQFIRSGQSKTVLVIGAEVLSHFINWNDRNSCILFGDGAGAAIVEQAPEETEHRILSSSMQSNGDLWELLYIPSGGSQLPVTPERHSQFLNKVRMNGKEIFKAAVRTLAQLANDELAKNNMTIEDIDWFIPHQANLRIIEAVAARVGVPMEKVLINLDRFGNTSAATVPTVFDEAVRDGRIQKGQYLLLDAFGSGLTYGAMLIRW